MSGPVYRKLGIINKYTSRMAPKLTLIPKIVVRDWSCECRHMAYARTVKSVPRELKMTTFFFLAKVPAGL